MKKKANLTGVYDSDDVIHGYGEVKAVETEEGLQWMLPGNILTACREEALRAAQKMDRLIQANVPRYKRALVW